MPHSCQGTCLDLQLPISPQTMSNEDGSDASQSMFEMMSLPSHDLSPDFDPTSALGDLEPVDPGWRGDQLPLVIQDLLSGLSTY